MLFIVRDEIYCQICKQLQENSNRGSFFRGWILLSICLGIFPPTQSFFKVNKGQSSLLNSLMQIDEIVSSLYVVSSDLVLLLTVPPKFSSFWSCGIRALLRRPTKTHCRQWSAWRTSQLAGAPGKVS